MCVWGSGFAASCGGMAKAKKRLGAECRWRTTGETAPRCFEPWRLWGRKKRVKTFLKAAGIGTGKRLPDWLDFGPLTARGTESQPRKTLPPLFRAPALEERKALG